MRWKLMAQNKHTPWCVGYYNDINQAHSMVKYMQDRFDPLHMQFWIEENSPT